MSAESAPPRDRTGRWRWFYAAAVFLNADDESHAALIEAVGLVAAEVNRHAVAGAWSGIDGEALRAAIEALDPIPDEPVAFATVVDEVGRVVLANGLRPSDPTAVAHLHSPTFVSAAATELAIGMTNQSMDSYDQAPAATLVEDRLVRRLAEVVGLPARASGVMTAGGTASNLMGLVLAREAAARHRNLDVAADGLPASARRWRILTSDTSHFSVTRAAMLMGLGRAAVVRLPVTSSGSIDVEAMDTVVAELRAEGDEVIAVVGTAGTTDLGAFDPLAALAARARDLDAWFHVDAAVGGAFALSDRLRPALAGIELADSVTVDLHKLWWQPISASALLVADASSFELIRQHSEYLDREEDAETGVLNLVGRSLDTSRRFDALKALVSLRSVGRSGMAAMLEHVVDVTTAAARCVEEHPAFELLAPPSSVMVVFRWCGDRRLSDAVLDEVNTEVQRQLFDSGRAVIGRTRHEGRVALKFTVVNPGLTVDDLVGLLALIDDAARGEGEPERLAAPDGQA